MHTKTITLLLCCIMLLQPSYLSAGTSFNEAKIKQIIKNTLGLGNVFRSAIGHAYAKGYDLGRIPTDPLISGINKPETYAHDFITGAKYDASGRVFISFRNIPELGPAANRLLVFVPTPNGEKRQLRWRISEESTVPKHLLPLGVTISGEPIFKPFIASTPALIAFRDWHRAVMKGDVRTYLRLSMVQKSPVFSEQIQLKIYEDHLEEIRKTMPMKFMVSEIETLPADQITFKALAGC